MSRIDPQKHRERALYTIAGVLLIACGIAVFLAEPENAGLLPLFLCGFGGGMIERSLVLQVLRVLMRAAADSSSSSDVAP